MAFLEFTDIDKSFGENKVISNFNLKVEKGKFLTLLLNLKHYLIN